MVKKSNLCFDYWESYDNLIDFMAAILSFSFQNNPLRMTALHRPRYYYGILSMHNQKRNKLLSAKTRLPSWLPDHIDFTDKNTKKHILHPSILGVRNRETSFSPREYLGSALKGLIKECLSFGQKGFVSNLVWFLEGVKLVYYDQDNMLIYSDIIMPYAYMSYLSLRV